MKPSRHRRVLFVCTGNICRSPTAEGVMRALLEREWPDSGVIVDSAGTHDYQIGEPPFRSAIAAAARRGYALPVRQARQLDAHDFARHGWILAMDFANMDVLEERRPPNHRGHVGLLLDLVPNTPLREVPDPYHGSDAEYDRALALIEQGVRALLDRLRKR